jgi:MFS transporter, DHA2 family, multidrug resistance protein
MIKQRSSMHNWLIFLSMTLAAALMNYDIGVVNLAVPVIAKDLHANMKDMQWIVNIFTLCMSLFIIIGGKYSDQFSKKKIFLIGLFIFLAGVFIAGTSSSFLILLFGRFLQGVGAGIGYLMPMNVIFSVFAKKQKEIALGVFFAVIAFAQGFGPAVGGVIIKMSGWHWIFIYMLPFGILSFFSVLFFYKEDITPPKRMFVDYLGILFFGAFILLLMLPIIEINSSIISTETRWLSLFLSLCCFIIFIRHERKIKAVKDGVQVPLINFSLFKTKMFRKMFIVRATTAFPYFSCLFLLPLYFLSILRFSTVKAGFMLLIMMMTFSVGVIIFGKIISILKAKESLVIGLISYMMAMLFFINFNLNTSLTLIIISLIFLGLALALVIPFSTNLAVSSINKKYSGEAIALTYTIVMVIAALGPAISPSILSLISNNYISTHISYFANFSAEEAKAVYSIAHGMTSLEGGALSQYFDPEQAKTIGGIARDGFIKGFSKTMYLNLALLVYTLVLILRLKFNKK